MVFSVKFDRMLIFQGLRRVLMGNFAIFSVVKSGEMLDFSGFSRSGYRSCCLGDFEVKHFRNVDFIRGLWIEEICPSWLPAVCSKM